jgi:hypothetical protein
MKNNKYYKSINEVSAQECAIAGHNCATCMHCENLRDSGGQRLDPYFSGIESWCLMAPRVEGRGGRS